MPSSVPADVLASIANGQYSPTYTPPEGYQPLSNLSSVGLSVDGSYGAISANVYVGANNQFIIAFEGTNLSGPIGDAQLYADQQILAGVSGTQNAPLSQANAYLSTVVQAISNQYPGATFTVTGHSLGGSEADYAVEQLEGGSQPPVSDAQISVVSFDAAALAASTIGSTGTLNIDATNVSSYADPVLAGTLASGTANDPFELPGDPSSNLIYVDTGTDPATIIDEIAAASAANNAPAAFSFIAPVAQDLLDLEAGALLSAAAYQMEEGHSMSALQSAIDAQSQASSSGSGMAVSQLNGSGSLTPLVEQIAASTSAQELVETVQAISNWGLSHGLGTDSVGGQTLQSDLSGQDLAGAEVLTSSEGVIVVLADGAAYALDSNGQTSEMTLSTTASGEAALTINYSDGSSITEVANAGGGATITSTNSSGNPSDIMTVNADGAVVSDDQFNADGSSDALTYNAAGEAVSETTYAPDGSVAQQQNFSYDSSGNLTEVDTSNGAGVLVNTEVYNADGSSVSTDFNAAGEAASDVRYAPDGSVTQQQSFAYDSAGNLTTIDTYDPAGNLLSVEQFASDGSTTVTQFSGGQPVSVTVTTPASTLSYDAGQIVSSLSSTIGNLLSQNGSIFDKIAADTISGDIGSALQQLLTMSSSYTVSLVQVGVGDVSIKPAENDNWIGEKAVA